MARLDTVLLLRATAALLVALGHLQKDALILSGGSAPWLPLDLGVFAIRIDLLFAISGFILVYGAERNAGTPGAWQDFLKRRMIRVMPLYWIMSLAFFLTTLAAPALLASNPPGWGELVRSLFFIPYADDAGLLALPIYKVGWTLNYEVMFYLLFACFYGFERRFAATAVVGVLALMVAIGASTNLPQPFAFWCRPIVLQFAFGAVIGILHADGVRIAPRSATAMVIGVLLTLFGLDASGLAGQENLHPLVRGLPGTALLAALVLVRRQPVAAPAPSRLRQLLMRVGEASFAIYLIHPLVIRVLHVLWTKAGLGAHAPVWVLLPVGMALLLPISFAVHRYFDAPATRWLRTRLLPEAPARARAVAQAPARLPWLTPKAATPAQDQGFALLGHAPAWGLRALSGQLSK